MSATFSLSIVECRSCGAAYWFDCEHSGPIDGGPCCFGNPILDVDTYPTERLAIAAYGDFARRRDRAIRQKIAKAEVAGHKEAA